MTDCTGKIPTVCRRLGRSFEQPVSHSSSVNRNRQRRRQQALVQQAQALLEQLIAALCVTQLRQQPRQFRTGFRVALHAQAAFQIVPGLAPKAALQTQAPQGQQQARIGRMILEPALGSVQLTCRIAAANESVEARQMTVVVALERRSQDLFGLDLSTQLPKLLGIREHQLRLLTLS